jgi:hypothetical protein
MVDTFGRPVQGALERPATRIKALGYYLLPLRGKVGLTSEAALHEKTACSRYFSGQAGKVNATRL